MTVFIIILFVHVLTTLYTHNSRCFITVITLLLYRKLRRSQLLVGFFFFNYGVIILSNSYTTYVYARNLYFPGDHILKNYFPIFNMLMNIEIQHLLNYCFSNH